jgi:hypothetical protein
MNYVFLLWLIATSAFAIPPGMSIDGEWIVRENERKIPKLQVNIDSVNQKVSLTAPKKMPHHPPSIGITFLDSEGNRTLVELKVMELPNFPARYYEGQLPKGEPIFVGFEVKIPLYSVKPAVIHSQEMEQVKHQ